jgi:hypothetical protein
MRNRRRALGVVLTVALSVTPARIFAAPTRAETRDDAVVRASLAVDASALGDAASIVQDRIRVRGEALLRAHDVLPGRGPTDPVIAIAVEPLGAEPGYRCSFAVRRGEEIVAGTEGTSLCQLCTEEELVDHLEAAIERVVPQVPATRADESPEARIAPPLPEPRRPELRVLGKVGLASAITGGVMLGVGVGLAARDVPDGEDRTIRTAGIAVASVSFALLVAGLTMVAVDVRRGHTGGGPSTRAHTPRRRAAWRLAPSAGRTSAGLVVHGRF